MNASSWRAAVRRTVGVAAAGLVLALAPATAAYAASAPTIDAPMTATTYTRYSLPVATTGDTEVAALVLLDGATPVDTLTCDPAVVDCAGAATWTPTTAGTASLTLEARDINGDLVATSEVSPVVVTDVAPTLSISPSGTEVSGAQGLTVSAATDPAQVDEPLALQLFQVGVEAPVGSWDCPSGSSTCEHTFPDAVPLTAAGATYTYTATVTTALRSGTGDPRAVVRTRSSSPGETRTFTTPAPAVTISAPAATTSTTPAITATATTAPFLSDVPASVRLTVDGVASGAPVPCTAVVDNTCDVTLPWEAPESGTYTLTADVITSSGATGTGSTGVTVDLPPTVDLAGPADGDTVTGVVTFDVTASTDPGATDRPATLQLVVNGADVGPPVACGVDDIVGRTCTKTLTYDTSNVTGPKTFAVRVATDADPPDTADSRSVTVGIDSPLPEARITGSYPDPVSGVVGIGVAASTDAALSDVPTSIEVYDGGTKVGTLACPAPLDRTCSGTIDWDTTLLDGDHALTARVITQDGVARTSAAATVVRVVTPAAVAAIDATGLTGTLVGTVSVPVRGSTGTGTTHHPASLALLVDGAPVGTPVTCPAQVRDCSGMVTWDATGLTGNHDLTAVVTTTAAANGAAAAAPVESAAVTVTASTPAPTVTVSVGPVSRSTVKGLVTVSVTASSDARLTDRTPTSITLSGLGGALTPSGPTQSCGGTTSCTRTWEWDTTALTGAKAITASASFENTASPVQGTTTVMIANPLPSVAFTSPSSGIVVTGTTTIRISASTDSSTTDFPKTLQMLVNGSVKASKACVTTLHACAAVFSWSPGTLDGPQVFTARITTVKGAVRTTATRTYYAYYRSTTSSTTISALSTVVAGTRVTVRGRVIAARTGAGVGGITVRVTRDPAIGSTVTSSVTTSSSGAFSISFTARTTTVVTARALSKTYRGRTWFTGSSRTARQLVRAAMTCTVVDTSLSRGQTGRGSCVVPALPAGTALTLTATIGGRTTTLASGRSRSTTITFSFVFPARGTYTLRVNLASNAVFAATSSRRMTVTQA